MCAQCGCVNALQVVVQGGHTASREEALLYVLYRYAQGVNLLLCQQHFDRDQSTICRVIQHVELHIYKHAEPVLTGFHPGLLSRDSLTIYRDAIAARGCPVPNVFGFLDGCKWEITRFVQSTCWSRLAALMSVSRAQDGGLLWLCVLGVHGNRPGGHPALQQALYSGYICGHAMSYHVLTTADGMIAHIHGPCPGRVNDLNVLVDSRLLERMAECPGTFEKPSCDGKGAFDPVLTSACLAYLLCCPC